MHERYFPEAQTVTNDQKSVRISSYVDETYLVELVAEVYWVDIVTLQVRKHTDLLFSTSQKWKQA